MGAIERALRLGLDVEADNPDAATPKLTDEEIEWIAAWLEGEGFHQ